MADRLDSTDLERALQRLGTLAEASTECDLLLVGGARNVDRVLRLRTTMDVT